MSTQRDLEESDDELESSPSARGEASEFAFWRKKQRELLTTVVDYNLKSLSDLVIDENIRLDPEYQRRDRWDNERQSKLIESFLLNVPVPPIFFNEDDYGSYSVIDGKQRITAIVDFMRGRLRLKGLKIFSDVNDFTFDDLPQTFKRIIETRPTIRAVIVLRQSDPDIKHEVFRRLNTGGVRLNAQEIRNSVYAGKLNDLIVRLSEDKRFHHLLGIKSKQRSAIWKEMRDAEFVLRFLTFHDSWKKFQGGIKGRLDDFMEQNKSASKTELAQFEDSFLCSIRKVQAAFGSYAFRRWQPEKGIWRKQVLASLFDAQMLSCQYFKEQDLHSHHEEIIAGYKHLFENPEYRRSIDQATNTPEFFRTRIQMTRAFLSDTLSR